MKVLHTIQSPGNKPVTYAFTNSTDAIGVVAAVADLLRMDYSDLPEKIRPVTLAIHVEM